MGRSLAASVSNALPKQVRRVQRLDQNQQIADGVSGCLYEPDDCQYDVRQGHKDTDNQAAVNRVVVQGVDLATAQREDDDLGKLWEFKERSDERPLWADVSALSPTFKAYWTEWDSVVVEDGILYRRWHGGVGNRSRLLPVVPRNMQDLVLGELHSSRAGGHFGRKKTLRRVKESYYWIQRQRSVYEWCQNCQVCSTRKELQRLQTQKVSKRIPQKVWNNLRASGSGMKRRDDHRTDQDFFRPDNDVRWCSPRVEWNTSRRLAKPWDPGPYRAMDKLTDVVNRVRPDLRSGSTSLRGASDNDEGRVASPYHFRRGRPIQRHGTGWEVPGVIVQGTNNVKGRAV